MSDSKPKKAWFKRVWVWIGVIVLIVVITTAMQDKEKTTTTNESTTNKSTTSESEKLSVQETYDKITKDMTKDEAEAIIGKDSGSCSVTENDLLGKMETCTYGGSIFSDGMLIIGYQNDKVDSKTISKY